MVPSRCHGWYTAASGNWGYTDSQALSSGGKVAGKAYKRECRLEERGQGPYAHIRLCISVCW
uniref:Uncharacterized protein n=1 Tax=Setaria viridis TaxID=4556 RepID=A0A4U6TBH8_SETVI|nr:hypothetical protein SEVIR_9G517701v2 [Setaria viridis]